MRYVYLPSNLNLRSLLEKYPPEFRYHLEEFYFIIGTVVHLNSYYKKTAENVQDESQFISLNAQLLQRRIRAYNSYLNYLLVRQVLQCDHYYQAGKKSRGYRLADMYMEEEYVYTEIAKRNLVSIPEEVIRERTFRRRYFYLSKWFNDKLHIDYDGASHKLLEMLESELKTERRKKVKKAKKRYSLRKISLDKFHRQLFSCNVDDTCKRFHSNLTNMKSELRNYISYDSQTLCSVDVNNSQPFISTILFNRDFYKKEKGKVNLYSTSRVIFDSISCFIPTILSLLPASSSSIMLVKSSVSQCRTDLELYTTLVDKGWFYEYISEKYQAESKLTTNYILSDQ